MITVTGTLALQDSDSDIGVTNIGPGPAAAGTPISEAHHSGPYYRPGRANSDDITVPELRYSIDCDISLRGAVISEFNLKTCDITAPHRDLRLGSSGNPRKFRHCIYLVYTWYILLAFVILVYTRYMTGICFLGKSIFVYH
jgi:hypothetical protein